MPSIRIIETPPGFAPEHIRKEWVGLTIPIVTDEQLAKNPLSGFGIGNDNTDGYIVSSQDAIKSLSEAKRMDAYGYWNCMALGMYLRFRRDVCVLEP